MTDSKGQALFRKPRPDFPLYPHRTGRWAKRVRGKIYYFGKCAGDPRGQAALTRWLDEKDDLLAGRKPRSKGVGLTVGELCDRFLQAKELQREAGELKMLTWNDYKRTTDRIVAMFGKKRLISDLRSEDFESLRGVISKTRGLVALGNEIQRVRVVFKYAFDASLVDVPVRFGPVFKRPSRKVLRKQRKSSVPKQFSSSEVRQLLNNATTQLKAMIFLAVNCGFGNNDCATLPFAALDLREGWVDFARPKTGIHRRCHLWPETVKALKGAIQSRRSPKNELHAPLVFITAAQGSFAKDTTDNPIAKEFSKLTKALGLQKKQRGFYSLRHTFRTVAGGAKDLEATRGITGHANEHVEDAYIEGIDDERLQAVSEHVRRWLFTNPARRVKPGKGGDTSLHRAPKAGESVRPKLRVVG